MQRLTKKEKEQIARAFNDIKEKGIEAGGRLTASELLEVASEVHLLAQQIMDTIQKPG